MGKADTIPDAWDDDWEKQADAQVTDTAPPPAVKISKAERLAKHAELNKRLWDSADSADVFPYLAARDDVPLKTDFKPAVKVLTRRPVAPSTTATAAAGGSLANGGGGDDDDDDDDDDGAGKKALSPEELRLKAQRDREEKQRRYEEVRQRLFGPPAASAPATTTTATSTATTTTATPRAAPSM